MSDALLRKSASIERACQGASTENESRCATRGNGGVQIVVLDALVLFVLGLPVVAMVVSFLPALRHVLSRNTAFLFY